MLALLGAGAICALLATILLNRCSPLVALILVPVAAALLGGFGTQTVAFILDGVTKIAPMAAMFIFAIVFFGVMTDAGLLDPIIARVLAVVGEKPARIVVGSALLALLVHLDGSGAVCFLVVIPAMLPLYERLGLDRRVLACVVSMAAGVNFLPWTGPMVRASAALNVPVMEIFRPMIPAQVVGLAFVFGAAWWLGKKEEMRLRQQRGELAGGGAGPMATALAPVGAPGAAAFAMAAAPGAARASAPPGRTPPNAADDNSSLRRPKLFWVNLVLTLAVMVALVAGFGAPAAVFMIGVALALLINYPRAEQQRQRVEAHARAALTMAAILLAAGAFTGILTGMGALKALAHAAVGFVPEGVAGHIPFGLSLIAMPLSMIFDPDSFYFGVMPVIAETYQHLGGHPVDVAQAALVGQMTAGFPVSPLTPATFLVAGLSGLDLSAHQRFAFPFLYAASLCMAIACLVFGVFPV